MEEELKALRGLLEQLVAKSHEEWSVERDRKEEVPPKKSQGKESRHDHERKDRANDLRCLIGMKTSFSEEIMNGEVVETSLQMRQLQPSNREMEEDTVTEQGDSEESTSIAAMTAGCDLAVSLGCNNQVHEQSSVHSSSQPKSPKSSKESLIHGAEMNQHLNAEVVSQPVTQPQSTAVIPTQQIGRVMKPNPWWKLQSLLTQKIPKE